MVRPILLLAAALAPAVALAVEPPPVLRLSSLPDRDGLAAALWETSPRLQPFRARIAEADAERERAGRLPNPALDASWNTVPIGETNPPGLDRPLAHVPNYAVGVSELVEIGKRGPRQRAASSLAAASREDARAALYDAFFDVSERVAAVAAAEMRLASLGELADDAHKLTEIQRARAERGDAAQLDVDRASLEEEKLWSAITEERGKMAAALRDCSEIVGLRCEPFGSSAAAQGFLAWRPSEQAVPEQRPDLRSLELQAAAAGHQLSLARARALPDPTFRVGYVRDQFLVSGNQGNSLFVGVSLPLPLFERGQADARVAATSLETSRRARAVLLDLARLQQERLVEQAATIAERRRRLRETTLPLAQSVVRRLGEAVRRGGAPLPDLLLARRSLGELTADAVELDLSAFLLANAEARLRGDGPAVPPAMRVTP